MSISDNIQEIADKIKDELEQSNGTASATADTLHAKAVAAIHSGGRLQKDGHAPAAWEEYMNLFAKSPEELARLIPTDGTWDDPVKRDARAYLVANGTCGPGTTMTIRTTVTNKLNLDA